MMYSSFSNPTQIVIKYFKMYFLINSSTFSYFFCKQNSKNQFKPNKIKKNRLKLNTLKHCFKKQYKNNKSNLIDLTVLFINSRHFVILFTTLCCAYNPFAFDPNSTTFVRWALADNYQVVTM